MNGPPRADDRAPAAPVLDRDTRAPLTQRQGGEQAEGWQERLADRTTRNRIRAADRHGGLGRQVHLFAERVEREADGQPGEGH